MNMRTFEMREKQLAELLGAKVLWEFISAVTEEIEKQELESTPGLLRDLIHTCKRNNTNSKYESTYSKSP